MVFMKCILCNQEMSVSPNPQYFVCVNKDCAFYYCSRFAATNTAPEDLQGTIKALLKLISEKEAAWQAVYDELQEAKRRAAILEEESGRYQERANNTHFEIAAEMETLRARIKQLESEKQKESKEYEAMRLKEESGTHGGARIFRGVSWEVYCDDIYKQYYAARKEAEAYKSVVEQRGETIKKLFTELQELRRQGKQPESRAEILSRKYKAACAARGEPEGNVSFVQVSGCDKCRFSKRTCINIEPGSILDAAVFAAIAGVIAVLIVVAVKG
jgi:hypothetical protein